jgi:hypothetical protein
MFKVDSIFKELIECSKFGEVGVAQNILESWLDGEIITALELFSEHLDFLAEEFQIMHSNLDWLESECVLLEEYELCAVIVKSRAWLLEQEVQVLS